MTAPAAARVLSPLLLAGLLTAPLLFVWWLLRPGYPPSLRRAAAIFTAVMTLVPLVGRLA